MQAEIIGVGQWEKDSQYQVVKYENRYYAFIVYDRQSCWVMDESIEEITEDQISQYV